MKWRIGRFRAALKILFELRREFKDIDGDAKVLLYRIDEQYDGVAIVGSFVGFRDGSLDPLDEAINSARGGELREFALAIEPFTNSTLIDSQTGVRIWFGDQALCRAMRLPIDSKVNRLEFGSVEAAMKMLKQLMFAEASFVTLRGDHEEYEREELT